MTALSSRVTIHDPNCPAHPELGKPYARCLGRNSCIEDLEAYVQAWINRSRRIYSPEEREDLVAENMRICLELASKFEPCRNGYDRPGRLCGYITKFLPLKAEDAYHRLHPEHRLVTQADGKRRYEYGEKAVSLEALTGEDPDREPLLAHRGAGGGYGPRARDAWRNRARREIPWVMKVAKLIARGLQPAEVAEQLGLTAEMVRHYERTIVRALETPGEPGQRFAKASELRVALWAQADWDAEAISRVADVLERDHSATDRDVAEMLEIESELAREYRYCLGLVWPAIETEAEAA